MGQKKDTPEILAVLANALTCQFILTIYHISAKLSRPKQNGILISAPPKLTKLFMPRLTNCTGTEYKPIPQEQPFLIMYVLI